MSSKALVTFGTGAAAELLELSEPGFRDYADRHGYELIVFDDLPAFRPASWFKVLALQEALAEFEEALWLDADILILNGEKDIADEVPGGKWQALVAHHTLDGEVPNHGVWFARRGMLPALETIWSMDRYTHHPWWEQAAGCHMLGYDPLQRPMVRTQGTLLFDRTHWLGLEWNSHRDDEHPDPRFWHASVRGSDRAALMRDRLAQAVA